MATRYEAADHPVDVDDTLRAQLIELYHETYDVDAIEERARDAGAAPPDDRDGWSIAYAYGPHGEDLGLVWSEPSYPED